MSNPIDLDALEQACDEAIAGPFPVETWVRDTRAAFLALCDPSTVRALVAVVRAELAQDALLASPNDSVSLSAWQKINADRRAALVPFLKKGR